MRESGALAACLGGLGVLGVTGGTGGIGEHDAELRADVGAAPGYLGVRLDDDADSAVQVWVVPTNEGRVAARDALALLA